jgi:uncharacterized repeat protein (TIGR01451 family)
MREERFAVGMLEPGQTARFDYVLTARGLEEIYSEVEAVYVCDLDVDDAASVVAQATTATRVIRLPALQVYVVDDVDPVPTDDQVTYTIRVLNEGDAPDQNIRITATLPNELEFENAEGPSDFQEQQQQIVFEPIEELAPGEELEYRLTAFAAQPGAIRLQVEVQSDSLAEPVRTEEPTRLFEADAQN